MKRIDWVRWFPFLAWRRPDAALLRTEGLSAISVAMVLVPQAVAYAALAGMPLATGLYAAFLPPLVAALWGGSSRLGVGPTALTCLLVFASLTGMAEPGSAQWVALAVWLALLSGALQLVFGLGGFGWLLNLISAPVLAGFTQAAGLLIIASQIPALIGLNGPWASLLQGPQLDLPALAFGLASLLLLWLGKTYAPRWPLVLLVVAASAIVSASLGFAGQGHAVIGALPSGLPSLYWPELPVWPALASLVAPAMVIALVSFLETASTAKVQNQMDQKRWDDNQDLIGQGLAKLVSALSGSFPTSTSFSRSAISNYTGARTGWSSLLIVALVLLALLLLMPALFHVPRAVLSAVVIVAVMGMLQPSGFVRLWRISRVECITSLATFAITLLSAPRIYWGVLAGVVLGLLDFLYQRLHPRIIEVGLHPDGSLRDRHLWKLERLSPHMYALRMDAELDFAAASSFERNISEFLAAHPDIRHVCLFAQPINRIDASGVEAFQTLTQDLHRRGIALHISGIKLPVEKVLRRAGLLQPDSLLHLYRADAEALERIAHL